MEHREWQYIFYNSSFRGLFLIAFWMLGPTNANSEPTIQDIKQAWQSHALKMPSFTVHCEIQQQRTVFNQPQADDPFGDPQKGPPRRTVDVSKSLTLKRRGTSLLIDVGGERYDAASNTLIQQTIRTALHQNSVRNYILESDDPFAMGMMAKGTHKVGLTRPYQATLTQFSIPVILWCDPLFATKASGFDIESSKASLELLDDPEFEKTIAITFHSKSGAARREIILKGHPPFLPIRSGIYKDGSPMIVRELNYVEYPGFGERVDSWKYSHYRGDSVLVKAREGSIKRFDDDQPLEDEDFELDFPVGTHILDYREAKRKSDSKYWIQSTEDTMERISPRDFGKLPDKGDLGAALPGTTLSNGT